MAAPSAAAAVLIVLLAAPTLAQTPVGLDERPRVERIRFEGAESLDRDELRAAIVTEETRCRSFILRPICAVTDWRAIKPRRYLDPEELPRDELRLRVFYGRRGFREAALRAELRPVRRGVEVVFRIEEGEPTRIRSLELSQSMDVLRGRDIRRAGLPREGDPLDLVRLDTALANLAVRLGESGYLDAAIHDTVDVATMERWADVEIRVAPGARTVVGEIEIVGNEGVADGTIGSAVSLREGSVLRTTDLAASQRSLYESNLFHEARVTVPTQPDSAKRVRIEVREAPARAARVGGGFNTVEFLQTEARYTHYNWIGGGRRLDLRFAVGNLLAEQLNGRGIFRDVLPPAPNAADGDAFLEPTWIASADLVQPAFRSSRNTLGLSAFAHRRTVPAVAIDRGYGGELSATRMIDRNIPATISYRYERTAVDGGDLYFCVNYGICDPPTVGALRQDNALAPLRFAAFTNRSDDPLAPTSGYRARLDLEHASQLTVSDFRYQRASGGATYYHPLGYRRNRVLAGRVRAGWVRPLTGTSSALGVGNGGEGTELALLHPRKRFYAGGSRSVRGYAENELGPRILTIDPVVLRNGNGEDGCDPALPIAECDPNAPGIDPLAFRARPLGGTSLLEASVEYRFPFWGPLQGAVFVDGAMVGQSLEALISEGTSALTPGLGGRLPTPVGPIRVDLGVRPRVRERLPVITESEDEFGERTLVTLEQLRDYDPLEGRGGGFLGQVLGRLTLHLSIGEAF